MTGIHTGTSTMADILGFFASAMSAPVGLKVLSSDPPKDLQLLHRVKRKNCPDVALAFLPRGGQIWIVHSRFMDGKHFDGQKARRWLEESSRNTDRGAAGEDQPIVPEHFEK